MITTVVLIDDLGAHRRSATRALQKKGWNVHTARNTAEGLHIIEKILQRTAPQEVLIITDLIMQDDPNTTVISQSNAGANLALHLRSLMESNSLPRVPIIALTEYSQHEVTTTAIAFGCDIVLSKPITPDLGDRILEALGKSNLDESDPVGTEALLRLLRNRLASQVDFAITLTEHDLTRALLAYRRYGYAGLGNTELAQKLIPQQTNLIQRGEQIYQKLTATTHDIINMDIVEVEEVLHGEIIEALSPQEQADRLAVSLSEYYRRRKEAFRVLLEVMTMSSQSTPKTHPRS